MAPPRQPPQDAIDARSRRRADAALIAVRAIFSTRAVGIIIAMPRHDGGLSLPTSRCKKCYRIGHDAFNFPEHALISLRDVAPKSPSTPRRQHALGA